MQKYAQSSYNNYGWKVIDWKQVIWSAIFFVVALGLINIVTYWFSQTIAMDNVIDYTSQQYK